MIASAPTTPVSSDWQSRRPSAPGLCAVLVMSKRTPPAGVTASASRLDDEQLHVCDFLMRDSSSRRAGDNFFAAASFSRRAYRVSIDGGDDSRRMRSVGFGISMTPRSFIALSRAA